MAARNCVVFIAAVTAHLRWVLSVSVTCSRFEVLTADGAAHLGQGARMSFTQGLADSQRIKIDFCTERPNAQAT